jgi:hypothetical protein
MLLTLLEDLRKNILPTNDPSNDSKQSDTHDKCNDDSPSASGNEKLHIRDDDEESILLDYDFPSDIE